MFGGGWGLERGGCEARDEGRGADGLESGVWRELGPKPKQVRGFGASMDGWMGAEGEIVEGLEVLWGVWEGLSLTAGETRTKLIPSCLEEGFFGLFYGIWPFVVSISPTVPVCEDCIQVCFKLCQSMGDGLVDSEFDLGFGIRPRDPCGRKTWGMCF